MWWGALARWKQQHFFLCRREKYTHGSTEVGSVFFYEDAVLLLQSTTNDNPTTEHPSECCVLKEILQLASCQLKALFKVSKMLSPGKCKVTLWYESCQNQIFCHITFKVFMGNLNHWF